MMWSTFVIAFLSFGVLEGGTLVAFHSTVSAFTLKNLFSGQIVIFDKVITNIGGAYHPNTGIFVTPLDGVYVFTAGARSQPGKHENFELVKDGSHIQTLYADSQWTGSASMASLTAVLELKRGNMVMIRAAGGSDEIHGEGFTFFTGWLL